MAHGSRSCFAARFICTIGITRLFGVKPDLVIKNGIIQYVDCTFRVCLHDGAAKRMARADDAEIVE